uniref:Uncharacterized protein n=1 Tax=Mycena chlorophos TaxID=658473 RepID=A0ABQ0LSN1_MYCCL|nr:predicted protein [Mycena chlorophos]
MLSAILSVALLVVPNRAEAQMVSYFAPGGSPHFLPCNAGNITGGRASFALLIKPVLQESPRIAKDGPADSALRGSSAPDASDSINLNAALINEMRGGTVEPG